MSSFHKLLSDLRAGLSGALIGVPQEINYGLLAFAPLGLSFAGVGLLMSFFASALGALLYALLGASKGHVVGPRPSLVVLVAGFFSALILGGTPVTQLPGALFVTILLAGLILSLSARLGFGDLFKYMPLPVLTGFTVGVAATLVVSAVPIALGAGFSMGGTYGSMLFRPSSLLVTGLTVWMCIRPFTWRSLRFVPAILQALVFATAVHWMLFSLAPFADGPTVGDLANGLPNPLHLLATLEWPSFYADQLKTIGKFALAIGMTAALETLAVSTQLESETSKQPNGNTLLQRLGVMYILLAPLLMPVAASLGRSVAIDIGGAQSRYAQVFYAFFLIVLVTLGFHWVALLPQAAIAGILIVVAYNMAGHSALQALATWYRAPDPKDKKRHAADLIVLLAVALITVADSFMTGLAVGTVAAMGLFIRDQSRSVLRRVQFGDVYRSLRIRSTAARELQLQYGREIVVAEAEGVLFFGSMDRLLIQISPLAKEARTVILDLRRITDIDQTACQLLRKAARQYRQEGCKLMLSHLPVERAFFNRLRASKVDSSIPLDCWFPDLDLALEHAEAELLQRHGLTRDVIAVVPFAESDLVLGMTGEEIETLAGYMRKSTIIAGELLFHQGDPGKSLFIVLSGAVSIHLSHTATASNRLIAFGPGAVFGEMALITGAPRSANAMTDEDSELLEFDNAAFVELQSTRPEIAVAILQRVSVLLADRLRNTTGQMRELSSE